MEQGEEQEVLRANADFYLAFESLDMGRMETVWDGGDHIKCLHPGWELLSGWKAVMDSWQTIFQNTKDMKFALTDISVDVRGEAAWVLVTENITSSDLAEEVDVRVVATNIFVKRGERWLIVHHHASPAQLTPRPRMSGLVH